MRILMTVLLASVAVATPAFAQDEVVSGPFTGGHVEALGGFDRVRGGGSGESGVAYGVAAGYDAVTSSGVLGGAEIEYSDANTKGCEDDAFVAGDRACLKAKRDLYAGGRAGFVTGNVLIYGKVGYSNFRLGATYDDGVTKTGGGTNLDGVRVGGGLETNLGNFLVKAEYRYTNYENDISRHQGLVGVGVRF